MRLDFTIFMSASNLRRRKLRSFLTIGGMAVGIALVVFLLSLGFGLQELIKSQVTNVEALTVLDVSKGESTLLKLDEDTVASFSNIENVQDVSPSLSLSGQIGSGDAVTDVAIYGIDPKFISLEGIKVNYGNEITTSDAAEIMVTTTALNLINQGDYQAAIGQEVTMKVLVPVKIEGTQDLDLVSKEVPVKVVGVIVDDELTVSYAPIKFLESLGFTPDYSAAKVKVDDQKAKEYNLARIKVKDESQLPIVRKQIEEMGYQVDSVADTVGQIDKIFLVFQAIMAGFGAIAMFVAAIGSLNTLTVSLLERTREIGLMKSLGATSGDIYRLFLVESITIGMVGGVVGVIVGYGMGEAANAGLNYLAQKAGGESVDVFSTPMIFVGVVVATSFFVSVFTGFYPARRASKINPLDALRYE